MLVFNFAASTNFFHFTGQDNSRLELKDVIEGSQIGSSFGFAVAVTDLNGDGQDDLLIGAPQYYENTDTGKYGGRVYIYIKSRIPKFRFEKQFRFSSFKTNVQLKRSDLVGDLYFYGA